jgi:hypothetical protein
LNQFSQTPRVAALVGSFYIARSPIGFLNSGYFSRNYYLYFVLMSSYLKFTSDKLSTIEFTRWCVSAFKIIV